MTRREFLKLSFLLGLALSLSPSEVLKMFGTNGGFYDFRPRPKGKIFKFFPKEGEVVGHRGTLSVENEILPKREMV